MIPTGRLALLFAGGVPLALGLGIERFLDMHGSLFLMPLLVWNAVVIGLALADLALGWRVQLDVRRFAPSVLSVGRPNPVSVELGNRARRTLDLEVNDNGADFITVGGMPASICLKRGERTTCRYSLVPSRRGSAALDPIFVRAKSPLGLWKRQIHFALAQTVRVYPDLQAVRDYSKMAQNDQASRMTRKRGGESEFERLREYTRDDDVRRIDWKATARRSTVIAREYQLERNQNIMFLLDLGRQMTAETDGLSYLDHALNALLMLSHVSVRAGDHVGLAAFGPELKTWLAPEGGVHVMQRMARATYDLFPTLEEANYPAAFSTIKSRLRKRSLLILFTQILDVATQQQLVPLVRSLWPTHLPLCVVFRDTSVEDLLHPTVRGDLETYTQGAAAAEVLWRERLVEDLRHTGALVLHVKPQELTHALIEQYLEVKARQLL